MKIPYRERCNTLPTGHGEPIKTTGDGNCLYRALSRILKGTEKYWALLKLGIFAQGVVEDCLIVEKVFVHVCLVFFYLQREITPALQVNIHVEALSIGKKFGFAFFYRHISCRLKYLVAICSLISVCIFFLL